mmetsp:Transcript_13167/g.38000  ORF Transcript_13167/g.38000 Transcript_13167/m.38000 type:complete len:203 (+) Transcript_13167:979-1587(+)
MSPIPRPAQNRPSGPTPASRKMSSLNGNTTGPNVRFPATAQPTAMSICFRCPRISLHCSATLFTQPPSSSARRGARFFREWAVSSSAVQSDSSEPLELTVRASRNLSPSRSRRMAAICWSMSAVLPIPSFRITSLARSSRYRNISHLGLSGSRRIPNPCTTPTSPAAPSSHRHAFSVACSVEGPKLTAARKARMAPMHLTQT